MSNKITISPKEQILIIYIFLAMVTLAVFWQVNQFEFIFYDDPVYVTENIHIQSGITLDGLRWAFSTTHAEFWHPLTWLSLMLDYQLFGLNAGGYHMSNIILHILSTLLLFWLFNRMTGAIWRSAFVAAFFAVHPLHVESVVWIAERKDVLSVFFWMLTLSVYVCYAEKTTIKRYLLVLFSFILALMSKSMVVTLPVIMILLDYWPLKRFQLQKDNFILWQLKEKLPFFISSVIFIIITLHAQPSAKNSPLISRLFNALVSFITYLEKTFWPHDMAVFYPFNAQIPVWQVIGASLLILVISTTVIVIIKRLPYLFIGWLWYIITILPVIGIIQVGNHAMADRYHYLPSIGIAVMTAWGIPVLIKRNEIKKKILFPMGITFLTIMALLTWKQCGYWKNNFDLFNHAVLVTKNNYLAYNNRGAAYGMLGQYQKAIENFNETIRLRPDYHLAYNGLGTAYNKLEQYHLAIENHNMAIRLKPDYSGAYNNRGDDYYKIGQYPLSIKDYNKAISLKPDYVEAFINRGITYSKLGQYQLSIEDYSKAIILKPNNFEAYHKRGYQYAKLGQYLLAIEDYNKAIRLSPNYADTYVERGVTYGELGQHQLAIEDFNKAISLNPENAEALNNRGFTYFKLGHNQRAIDDYTEAVRLKPDYAMAYQNRGIVYHKLGQQKLAKEDWRKASRLSRKRPYNQKTAKSIQSKI